ncbi:MAG: AsmA family protein, partial [Terriglobia bacterium]
MKSRLRLHARSVLLIASALLVAAWLVPPFFHAGRFRRFLKTGLESKLGRPVELGAVSFQILPHPGFSIGNVVIQEGPQFGSEPFARVDRMECDLRWRSLWRSQLDCARILLEHPDINVVRNRQGRWNIEDFFLRSGAVPAIRSSGAKVKPAGFELDVDRARLNFISGITKTAWAITELSGGLTLDPSSGSIRFHFMGSPVRTGLTLPAAPGTVEMSGDWKPGKSFHGPFNALIRTGGSLLYGWIPLLTSRNPEIYGVASAAMRVTGTPDRLNFQGEATLGQLYRWESLPPSSSMPVAINFRGSYNRPGRLLFIRTADAAFAKTHLHLAGAISHFPAAPKLDLVLAVERSHLSDIVSMLSRLSGLHSALEASGRVDGLLTIQGPWREKRYGGFVGVRSFRLRDDAITVRAPELGVQIGKAGARLLPARLLVGPHIECVAKGILSPAFPGVLHEVVRTGGIGASTVKVRLSRLPSRGRHLMGAPRSAPGYELTLSTRRASLHAVTQLARSLGVHTFHDLNAAGWADATVGLEGAAWPFTMPHFTVKADLQQAQLFVPGLTERVHFRRFHLEARDGNINISPLIAQIGPAVFTGWLSRRESRARKTRWEFDARTPRLSLEEASLWFAALG